MTLILHPTITPQTYNTIELTREEWAAKANKYRYRIDVDKATKEELVEFVQTMIYLYKIEDLIDNNL